MHHSVFFFIFFLLRKGPALHFSRLDIVAFSRIFSIPNMPVARRSSVSSANPFEMDSRAFLFLMGFPSRVIVPLRLVAVPYRFSKSSVRPEPSRPATPIISPRRAVKDTSRSFEYSAVRFLTSSRTSPISFVLGGYRFVSSRPTISFMISPVVRSAASFVAIHLPSRMIVTSSEICNISFILWEM